MVIQYSLTSVQSFGPLHYLLNKSPMIILGLAGVSFCKNEQTRIMRIIVCLKENTYCGVQGS